jgi:hypothetical protein
MKLTRLRMSGLVLPLPHLPLCLALGQNFILCYLTLLLTTWTVAVAVKMSFDVIQILILSCFFICFILHFCFNTCLGPKFDFLGCKLKVGEERAFQLVFYIPQYQDQVTCSRRFNDWFEF